MTRTTDPARPEPPDLEALRRLLEGASAAPWEWLGSDGEVDEDGNRLEELQDGHGEMVASGFRDDINLYGPGPGTTTDGRLCAAMRNALPALLDELDAAREARPGVPADRRCLVCRATAGDDIHSTDSESGNAHAFTRDPWRDARCTECGHAPTYHAGAAGRLGTCRQRMKTTTGRCDCRGWRYDPDDLS
jgi:hypothetical protein